MYGPTIHTVPSHSSFDEALARGLVARYGRDPERFSQGLVLVPSDGAKALMSDALGHVGGDLPLPRLVSLGSEDLEFPIVSLLEDFSVEGVEPAVDPLLRRMLLANLIQAAGAPVDNAEALRLGHLIALIIDEMRAGETSPIDAVNYLASEVGSLRSGRSVDLALNVIERWEAELVRLGRIDLAARRARILEHLHRQWQERPPSHFVCAADIVEGGYPAARLLRTVSELPQGCVVFSGLSLGMDEEAWSTLQTPLDRWEEQRLRERPGLWLAERSSRHSKRATSSAPRPGNDSRHENMRWLGLAVAAHGAQEAAPAAIRTRDAADDDMRFQANPPGIPRSKEDEYDQSLAGQSTVQTSEPSGVHALYTTEDDDGDHPDDWTDEPDEALGGLPFDQARDADDPTENEEGFDDYSDPDGSAVRSVAVHPQYHLKLLLQRMGVDRQQVQPWHWSSVWRAPPARSRAIDNAFDLPVALARCTNLPCDQTRFAGIRAFEAASRGHEALAIASALRDAVVKPDMSAALLTPDRDLARHVVALCRTWRLDLDDRVGDPLSLHPVGNLLLSIVYAAAQAFTPPSLLTLLKNPLVRSLGDSKVWSDGLRGLDAVRRESASEGGLPTLINRLVRRRPANCTASAMRVWWQHLYAILFPLSDMMSRNLQNLPDLIVELRRVAETLSGRELWEDEPGRAAKELLAELECHGRDARTRIEVLNFERVFRHFLDERVIILAESDSPRLSILGLQDARVHTPRLMIVAGLNEMTWPSSAQPDPWLTEQIRNEAGLPSLFSRTGQWAHAMGQALGAPEVLLTRSISDRGEPTRPSQPWLRLEALSSGLRRANELDDLPGLIGRPDRHGLRPSSIPTAGRSAPSVA